MFEGSPIIDPLCRHIMRHCNGKFNINLMEDYYYTRLGNHIKLKVPIELDFPIKNSIRQRVEELWPQFDLSWQHKFENELKNLNTISFMINYEVGASS
jgi:hypothetical protein